MDPTRHISALRFEPKILLEIVMSYLPSEDPKTFRRETLDVFLICVAFVFFVCVATYFTDGIVVKL